MRKYDQVCRKFTAFALSRGRDPYSIKFKEMDYEFIADFDAFMQTLDNKQYKKYEKGEGKRDKPDESTPGAPKLHPNYIAKILHYTSRLFNHAIRFKLISADDNPFKEYKIKEVKTEREELTLEEVKRIISLDLERGTKEWQSRNFFLISLLAVPQTGRNRRQRRKRRFYAGRAAGTERCTHRSFRQNTAGCRAIVRASAHF